MAQGNNDDCHAIGGQRHSGYLIQSLFTGDNIRIICRLEQRGSGGVASLNQPALH
jgi:hypothetical protein